MNGSWSLVFAELKHPVRSKLERYELIGPLDPAHFFSTIDAAIEAYRRETGAAWAKPVDGAGDHPNQMMDPPESTGRIG